MLKPLLVFVVTGILLFIKPFQVNTVVSSTSTLTSPLSIPIRLNNCNEQKHHLVCKKNEVKSDCIEGGCQAKTCSDLDRDIPCIKIDPYYCTKGCLCKNGYLRADNDTCIPTKACPSCGGDSNAETGCGVNCNKHCYNIDEEPESCIDVCYDNACDCKYGFYLDDNIGKCVLPDQCTPVCDINEVYDDCLEDNCKAENCSQLGYPLECNNSDSTSFTNGCVCKDGYLRANNGTCIPTTSCHLDCGENEVESDCIEGGCLPKTCSDLDRDIPCKKIDPYYCTKGCLCKDGYLRGANGTCIPMSSCTFNCSRPREIFVRCPQTCPPQICESIDRKYNCPRILIRINTTHCRPACRCEEGYFRNKLGECISKDGCLKCTGPNEYFSCGGACDNVCATLSEQNQTNCPIVNKVCNKMCYCEEGYARAKNNTCIPIDMCKESQCPLNEIYEQCPSSNCAPRTCSQLGFPLNCTGFSDDTDCPEEPGCVCIDGYVRSCEGKCIPINKCPSCGGDNNAESGCGINCGRHCSNYFKKGPVACPAICLLNGCQCKLGKYYDDVLRKCVDPKDCNPICGKNEVVSNCINGGCDKRNCSQINDEKICIDPLTCKKGCVCEKGYLRHPNGTCVPIKKCPPTCGKDEVYNGCIQGQCSPKKCSELGKSLACPRIDPAYCIEGCLCKEDYVRTDNGTCIPKNQCPSCRGDPNAKAGCGVNCNRHCSNIGKKPRPCPFICEINGCECKDGFYHDDNTGKCVLPDDCTPVCGENEIYTNCTLAQCGPKECSELGISIPCPAIDSNYCTKGCICQDGYVRGEDETCIPMKQCPSCGGDPNAESGCGVNCNKKCSDVGKKKPGFCIRICYNNACDCKDGFYYDINYKKCVPPQNCTLTTDPASTTTTPAPPIDIDTGLTNLRKGNIAMTSEFIYLFNQLHPGDSFVLSAISVLIAYAQLALYAFGQTLEQLLKATNLSSKDEIRKVYPVLIKSYQVQTSALFLLAVKTYGNINYPFSKSFKREAIEIFSSDVENVNFSENVKTADNINNWVKNKTHGLIDKLVSSDMFSAKTRMVIVNALYFKDNWKYQFNKNYTKNRDFYKTPNKTISIPTMYQERAFNYYESEDLDAQILEMPYDADNFTFVIWLPKQKDGLAKMIEKMRNPDAVIQSISNFIHTKVRVFMPSMNIETKIDVKDLSIKSNITDMFNPEYADFKGILEKYTPVFISEVVQQAKIIVTETGTEAAAATAVTITTLAVKYPPPEIIIFNANVPFTYSVLYKDDPIFSGVYAGDQ